MLLSKKMLPYLFLGMLCFYAVPAAIIVFGSTDAGMMLLAFNLLVLSSMYSLFSGFLFAFFNRFYWLYPLLLGALFLPAVFALYNDSALVYALVYTGAAYLGQAAACGVRWLILHAGNRKNFS